MICKHCGKEIDDTAKFCKFCGNKIEEIQQSGQEDEKPAAKEQPDQNVKKDSASAPVKNPNRKYLVIIIGLCIVIAVIVCIFVVTGSSSNEKDADPGSSQTTESQDENADTEQETDEDAQDDDDQSSGTAESADSSDIKILESGYSIGEDHYMTFGFVIENESKDKSFEYTTVTITAYDKKGDVLATGEEMMTITQPGEKQAYGSSLDCNGQNPAKVEFAVEQGDEVNAPENTVKSSDFKITGTNERTDDDYTSITGKIKNTSSGSTDSYEIVSLFKKDEKIVYALTTYEDSLPSGKEKAFELSGYDIPEHDSYEVSAINEDY